MHISGESLLVILLASRWLACRQEIVAGGEFRDVGIGERICPLMTRSG